MIFCDTICFDANKQKQGTGLDLDPVTGVLAGIPKTADAHASYPGPLMVVITASDAKGIILSLVYGVAGNR